MKLRTIKRTKRTRINKNYTRWLSLVNYTKAPILIHCAGGWLNSEPYPWHARNTQPGR